MEFETTIELNDVELPAAVEYDYQPAEKQTRFEPGFDEFVEITGIEIFNPFTNESVDMYSDPHYHLITKKIVAKLASEALEHHRNIMESYEFDKSEHLHSMRMDHIEIMGEENA